MSTTVDERVVEMRFDNKQFEAGVKTTLSSLDKLEKSLDLSGAAKGLEKVEDAANKCDMSKISHAAETVRAKFSALQIVGVTALTELTKKAMAAGSAIVKAFVFDPPKQGFDEYELKMNSIKTIVASTGEQLDVVNDKLNELNTYSDKTIYSFSDMTENIGKFTNAGVKLDSAVDAIQGIANVAAVSGANANEASRSMYNFAQALSAGYVKLIDWKSIELANMATVEFKQQLIDSAVAVGTLEKRSDGLYNVISTNLAGKAMPEAISATESFNDSLQYQWMTSDVLVKTLRKYSDASTDIGKKAFAAAQDVRTFSQMLDTMKESVQSGWAETWQIIIGDFDESKELFTGLNNFFSEIIESSSKSRNNLLKAGLSSAFVNIRDMVKDAGIEVGVFEDEIKRVAISAGVDIDGAIQKAGSLDRAFQNGDINSEIMRIALTNLTEQMSHLSDAEMEANGMTKEQIESFRELENQLVTIDSPLGKFIDRLNSISGRQHIIDTLTISLEGVKNVASTIAKAWSEVFPALTGEELFKVAGGIKLLAKNLLLSEDGLNNLHDAAKGVFAIMSLATNFISTGFSNTVMLASTICHLFGGSLFDMVGALGRAASGFNEWLYNTSVMKGLVSGWNSLLTNSYGIVSKWIDAIKQTGIVETILSSVSTALNGFSDAITEYFAGGIKEFNSFIDRVKQLGGINFGNIGNVISDFSKNVLGYFVGLGSLADTASSKFEDFKNRVELVFSKISSAAAGASNAAGSAISAFISHIVRVKDIVLKVASEIRKIIIDKLGVGELFAIGLSAAFVALVKKITDAVVLVSTSLSGLLDTIKGFSSGVLSAINTVSNAVSSYFSAKKFENRAKGIHEIARSFLELSVALLILTKIDYSKIAPAAIAMGLFAIGLGLLGKACSKLSGGDIAKFSKDMVFLSTSLLIITAALKSLSSTMESGNVWASIGALSLVLLSLTASYITISKKGKAINSGSRLIIAMAIGMNLIAMALKSLARIDTSKTASVILNLAAIVGALVILSKVGDKFKAKSAMGFAGISVSILVMVHAIKSLEKINAEQIVRVLPQFILIAGMISVLMIATRLAGGHAKLAGKGLMYIGLGLISISASIHILKKIDPKSLKSASNTIAKLIGVMSLIVAASALSGEHAVKAGIMLSLMGGTIFILSAVIIMLSHIEDPNRLKNATKAVAVIAAVLGGVVALSHFAAPASKTMTMVTASVISLSLAVAVLSLISPEKVRASSLGIAAIMLSMSILAKSAETAKKAYGAIIILTLVVGGIGSVLWAMGKFGGDASTAIQNAGAIALLLTSMSISCKLLAKSNDSFGLALASMGILTAIVGGLGVILGLMSHFDVSNAPQNALALSGLLLAMSVSCVILSGVGSMGPAGLVGLGILAALVAGTGIIMAGISALTQDYPNIEKDLDRAVMVLQKIGEGLGGFAMGILAGGIDILLAQLPKYGTYLSEFATNADPFITSMTKLDADAASGAESLANAFLALTKGDVLTQMQNFIGKSTDIDSFSISIGKIADGMVAYHTKVAAITDWKPVINSADAAYSLISVLSKIPSSGGWIEKIFGNKDLAAFGTNLASFGTSIKAFNDSVIDVTDWKPSTKAVSVMADIIEIASTVPNTGGLIADVFGDNSLSSFMEKLSTIGADMKAYNDVMATITDWKPAEQGTKHIMDIIEVLDDIPNTGGILESLVGGNSLSRLGHELVSFADSVTIYSNKISGIAYEKINTAVTYILDCACEAVDKVITKLDSKYSEFEKIGEYLINGFIKGFKSNIYGVKQAAKTIAQETISTMREELDIHSPSRLTALIGMLSGTGFVKGLIDSIPDVREAGSFMADSFSGSLEDTAQSADIPKMGSDIGSSIVDSVASGVSNNKSLDKAIDKKVEDAFKKFDELDKALANNRSYTEANHKLFGVTSDTLSQRDRDIENITYLRDLTVHAEHELSAMLARHSATVGKYGIGSTEAIESEIKVIEAQTKLSEAKSSLNKAVTESNKSSEDAYKAYNDLLTQWSQSEFLQNNYTWEEFEAYAKKTSGIVDGSILDFIEADTKYPAGGMAIMDSIGTGIENEAPNVAKKSVSKFNVEYTDNVNSTKDVYANAGISMMDALAGGITTGGDKAIKAAAEVGVNIGAALSSNDNGGPKAVKVGYTGGNKRGRPVSMIPGSSSNPIDVTKLHGIYNGKTFFSQIIGKTADEVARMIGARADQIVGLDKVNAAASRSERIRNGEPFKQNSDGSITFIQNITSPKPLDRAEIRHDTKGLLDQKFK